MEYLKNPPGNWPRGLLQKVWGFGDRFTRLRGNENNDNQKILFWEWGVNMEIASPNYPHFRPKKLISV
jgi:hypothetical protein